MIWSKIIGFNFVLIMKINEKKQLGKVNLINEANIKGLVKTI